MNRIVFLCLLVSLLWACGNEQAGEVTTPSDDKSSIMTILTQTRTTQYFSEEVVPREDITAIIEAGLNATSGRNMQSWHFSAIINPATIKELAKNMVMGPPPAGAMGANPQGNPPVGAPAGASQLPPSSSAFPKAGFATAPSAIAVSCSAGNEFSAGLACENMFLTAVVHGYGAKIVAGGASALNTDDNKKLLGIPDGMNVVAILLVGKLDPDIDLSADGVTGASSRKPFDEVATIVQ